MFFRKKGREEAIEKCESIDIEKVKKEILTLEDNVFNNNSLGKDFTILMKSYNIMLNEARQHSDTDEINKWLDKIDVLMKKTKDIARGI